MAKFVPQAEMPLVDQVRVRHEKLQALQQEGKDPFQITRFDVTHHAQEVKDGFAELEEQSVRLAGRIMSKRGMGKAIFADLQDRSGRVQLYIKVDEMGEEAMDILYQDRDKFHENYNAYAYRNLDPDTLNYVNSLWEDLKIG